MAKKQSAEEQRAETIQDIKSLDAAFQQLVNETSKASIGAPRDAQVDSLYSTYSKIIRRDSATFNKNKTMNISSYGYIANLLLGKSYDAKNPNKGESMDIKKQIDSRLAIENLFTRNDSQLASIFLTNMSDRFHIYDEIESVCAYMYQLEEAIDILRDNVMNAEQSLEDIPFDISFDCSSADESVQYVKIAKDVWKNSGLNVKLNDHIVPKMIKYGEYWVISMPYSEIGVKLMGNREDQRKLFDIGSSFTMEGDLPSNASDDDKNLRTCLEGVNVVLDTLIDENSDNRYTDLFSSDKNSVKEIITENLKSMEFDDSDTIPNMFGITESAINQMSPEMKRMYMDALKKSSELQTNPLGSISKTKQSDEDARLSDGTLGIESLQNVTGCFNKLVDPRQLVPIKILDHVLGYYYFENYDYARIGTSITDILSNQMNFNDQHLVIDNIVGSVLKKLKYGELLQGDNDFKSLILNCVLYAERRNNPVRIKFIPVEFVTRFATNKDEDGNGLPVLLRSLIFARLYISLLLFLITTIITKSTDTEFYYLKEGSLSPTFQEQVADIIEQFRNSSVDISQVVNGNLLHGNRAIQKRYFMTTGTQDQKPFDVEVVSGQQVDIHNDLLQDLKKMAIGATGVPSVAIDNVDEVEFATILKMTNIKTLARANHIQYDVNGTSTTGITGLLIKQIKYCKPNAIPDDILATMQCTLHKNNTINNNIAGEEINNVIATVDNMIETYYKGQNTETPGDMEYIKEAARKQLIMKFTPSLPWGDFETMKDNIALAATKQKLYNQMMASKTEDGSETV